MKAQPVFIVALILAIAGAAPTVNASITRIEIEKRESPAFGGASFGDVGQYEKLVGRAYGELDPNDELNRGIVYLDRAPRNAAGRVEYSTDVFILKPIDIARGNRTILYDVVNRGDARAIYVFNVGGAVVNDPKTEKEAGDGFLMRQGYTLVASGWQGDVPSGGARLVGHFPVVREADGRPIVKTITAEYVFTKPAYSVGLGRDGERDQRPYPAVPERMKEAKLLRRAHALAPREAIPASEWSFAKCPDGTNATPSNVVICYPAGFSPDYLYELVYVAQDPMVMGIGFAATRDLISFLRYERSAANPLLTGADADAQLQRRAIGFGRSQSGRYIKDLVHEGFNQDESRRIVFDGIIPRYVFFPMRPLMN